MDHYDVLGIRPSASKEEIDLAYKGRRTQYHPDKYQGSDADTLAWATAKMQEVNAAYAALSDPSRRSRFDRDKENKGANPRSAEGQSAARPLMRDVLERRPSHVQGSARTYFSPNIPIKKLSAALGSYGDGLSPEDILVLVDTTVFGGAKEGVLVTEEGIRTKDLASAPCRFWWKNVQQIEISGTDIYINAHKIADCTMADPDDLRPLFRVIQDHLTALRSDQPTSSATSNNRRSNGSEQAATTDQEKYAYMFQTAKNKLLELCDFIEVLEAKLQEDFIDRDNAAGYFEYLEECLSNGRVAEEAFLELGQIAVLSQCAINFQTSEEDPPDAVIAERDGDSQLVHELRSVSRFMVNARAQYEQKARTNEFFSR